VVPTYNERVNLPIIVPAILQQDPRVDVLVVDDNSPDGTGAIADTLATESPRVHVLHREAKQGLGKAYLAGFTWALARSYDLLIEMDADFSHDPKFLPELIRAAGEADLVIGSRYKTGVNVINWPMSRLLLSIGANQYARWITGLPLTDSTEVLSLALGFDAIWVGIRHPGRVGAVLKLDATSGKQAAEIPVDIPARIEIGFGSVWVTDSGSSSLVRITP